MKTWRTEHAARKNLRMRDFAPRGITALRGITSMLSGIGRFEITFFRKCLNSNEQEYDSPLFGVTFPLSVDENGALDFARHEFRNFFQAPDTELAHFHRIQLQDFEHPLFNAAFP